MILLFRCVNWTLLEIEDSMRQICHLVSIDSSHGAIIFEFFIWLRIKRHMKYAEKSAFLSSMYLSGHLSSKVVPMKPYILNVSARLLPFQLAVANILFTTLWMIDNSFAFRVFTVEQLRLTILTKPWLAQLLMIKPLDPRSSTFDVAWSCV